MYVDEPFRTHPSELSVVHKSENEAPPAWVNSLNVPSRSSVGFAYEPGLAGGPALPATVGCIPPPLERSGHLPDKGAAELAAERRRPLRMCSVRLMPNRFSFETVRIPSWLRNEHAATFQLAACKKATRRAGIVIRVIDNRRPR